MDARPREHGFNRRHPFDAIRFDAAWKPAAAMLAASALFGWIAVRRFAWEE